MPADWRAFVNLGLASRRFGSATKDRFCAFAFESLFRLARGLFFSEDVSFASNCLDETFLVAVFQFRAEVSDVDLDNVGFSDVVISPGFVEDELSGQYLFWILREESPQVEFFCSQIELTLSTLRDAVELVHPEVC